MKIEFNSSLFRVSFVLEAQVSLVRNATDFWLPSSGDSSGGVPGSAPQQLPSCAA